MPMLCTFNYVIDSRASGARRAIQFCVLYFIALKSVRLPTQKIGYTDRNQPQVVSKIKALILALSPKVVIFAMKSMPSVISCSVDVK